MTKPHPHAKIIDEIGGSAVVLDLVLARTGKRLRLSAVSNWRVRGIPYRWRPMIAEVAQMRGLSIPRNFLGITRHGR